MILIFSTRGALKLLSYHHTTNPTSLYIRTVRSYAENFCLENPFDFIWNLKTSFEIWKFGLNLKKKLSCLKIYFKRGPRRVVQCACIQPCHVINLHMAPLCRSHVWNKFSDRTILFQMEIIFSNSIWDFKYLNANGFSKNRSFGHFIWMPDLKFKSRRYSFMAV